MSKSVTIEDFSNPFTGYRTYLGRYWATTIEDWFKSAVCKQMAGKVNLILTSPPFPLNRKKSYGNLNGDEYLNWLKSLATPLRDLLADDGSLVIEVGNAWNPGEPTMTTLPLESLMAVKSEGDFSLCQEFICHNPARLPSPTQWVNVERARMKDSWTRIWWLSKTARPKADNRNALLPYSKDMMRLLKSQKYNAGSRPSEHRIGSKSFLKDNGGSIPASCFTDESLNHFGSLVVASNTINAEPYLKWCRDNRVKPHPARMQTSVARLFISFLTSKGDLVFDPFAGSNTTGAAAQALGRRWASVEANTQNIEASKSRLIDRRTRT